MALQEVQMIPPAGGGGGGRPSHRRRQRSPHFSGGTTSSRPFGKRPSPSRGRQYLCSPGPVRPSVGMNATSRTLGPGTYSHRPNRRFSCSGSTSWPCIGPSRPHQICDRQYRPADSWRNPKSPMGLSLGPSGGFFARKRRSPTWQRVAGAPSQRWRPWRQTPSPMRSSWSRPWLLSQLPAATALGRLHFVLRQKNKDALDQEARQLVHPQAPGIN